MSFMFYDLTFLVVFTIFVIVFMYRNRKNVKREGVMYLYRTRIGMKAIEYVGKKHKKLLSFMEYIVIISGYILMAVSLYLVYQLVYIFINIPDVIRAVKIPPIAPLIPYIGEIFHADYLPPFYFTYFIVVLGITAVFHEFFHGIFARKNNIRIKSTGFAFLGPFFGAFVEQDEKQMNKAKRKSQIAILSAGTFANVLVTIVFVLIIWGFFSVAFTQAGAMFNFYSYSDINVSSITNITDNKFSIDFDGGLNLTEIKSENKTYFIQTELLTQIGNHTTARVFDDSPALRAGILGIITEFDNKKIRNYADFKQALEEKKPGDTVIIKTVAGNRTKVSSIVLGARADNSSQAYLGIAVVNYQTSGVFSQIRERIAVFKDPYTYYVAKNDLALFIYNLLWWIVLINISVAIFNMLPVGIFDGGRMFYLTVEKFAGKKIAKKAYKFMTYLFIAILVLITALWFFYTFVK